MPLHIAPPHVALPTVSCRTTCCSAVALLLELASAVVLFVFAHRSAVHSGTLYVGGALGVLSLLCGVLGMMRSTPALIASLMVAVSTSFAFVLLGGLSAIFSAHLDAPMATYFDQTLEPVTAAQKTQLTRDAKLCLSFAAALLLTSALVHALFGRHLYFVVGERRGAIAFLQIFAIVTLPFSVFLVVGGQYIVDTGTLASAPYTGILVFAVGVAMLIVALMAFVGATFEYRRLLSICCLLSFVSGTSVVGVSIAYFAMRAGIHANLLEHWETIRDVLPPTYQARYDREQFGRFMETNLKLAAFVGIVAGIFLMLEAAVCLTLMHHSTLVKRQLAHDKETAKHVQIDGAGDDGGAAHRSKVDPGHAQAHLRRQWTVRFETSKRRQRLAMRLAAAVFVLGVAFIFSVLCANVVFVSKCSSIGKLMQAFAAPLVEAPREATVETIRVTNHFARGTVAIAPLENTTSGQMQLSIYGNEGGGRKASDFYRKSFAENVMSFTVSPLGVTRFLWIDGSCQRSVMTLSVPSDPPQTLEIATNTSVEINSLAAADDSGETLTLRGVRAETAQSNIKCAQVAVLSGGLDLRSLAGHVTVQDVSVNGRGSAGVDTTADLYSELGQVEIQNASLVASDLTVASGAGTVFVSDIESRVFVQSTSGGISATNVRANWVDLKNEHGDVYASSIFTEGTSAFMGRLEVTTVSGDITLQQVDASGNVHVESSSGDIKVQLTSLSFTGMYFMRSERGSMTIRKGKYAGDVLTELSDSVDGLEKHGAINCNAQNGSCLSYGDLHLRSQYGDIEIVLGCDTFQCN